MVLHHLFYTSLLSLSQMVKFAYNLLRRADYGDAPPAEHFTAVSLRKRRGLLHFCQLAMGFKDQFFGCLFMLSFVERAILDYSTIVLQLMAEYG